MTIFGKRVSAGVIVKDLKTTLFWNGVGSTSTQMPLSDRRGEDIRRRRGLGGKQPRQRLEGWTRSSRCWKRQEGSSLEAPKGAQPCRHLHFGLLVSRTVHECIPIVFSPHQENTLHGKTGACDPRAPPALILWAGSALGGCSR